LLKSTKKAEMPRRKKNLSAMKRSRMPSPRRRSTEMISMTISTTTPTKMVTERTLLEKKAKEKKRMTLRWTIKAVKMRRKARRTRSLKRTVTKRQTKPWKGVVTGL
jgi:hypothetical protein